MRISKAVEKFMEDVQGRALSKQTQENYRSDLRLLVSVAMFTSKDALEHFTSDLVRRYMAELSAKDLAPATLHRRQCTLREFARFCLEQRWIVESPFAGIRGIKRPRKLPRPFSREERERLWALPLTGREAALRAVLYFTGFRISPILSIRLQDVSFQPVRMVGAEWPGSIRTTGKGSKDHVVPMVPQLSELLRDYVLEHHPSLDPKAFLLCHRNGARWTRKYAAKVTRAWGEAANVERCTPHRFRHTTATVLLELDVNLRVIQRWLAHADLSTTAQYTGLVDRDLASAAEKLGSAAAPAPTGCRHDGEAGAYCSRCGERRTCAACAAVLGAGARFCAACGARVEAAADARDTGQSSVLRLSPSPDEQGK